MTNIEQVYSDVYKVLEIDKKDFAVVLIQSTDCDLYTSYTQCKVRTIEQLTKLVDSSYLHAEGDVSFSYQEFPSDLWTETVEFTDLFL